MKDRYIKLIKDFITVSLGSFGSKILSFLLVPFYTAVLSTTDYGTADLISTTIILLSPILTLSISEAVTRFILQKDGRESQYFSVAAYLWLFGIAIMAVVAPMITKILFNGQYTLLLFLFYAMSTMNLILAGYSRGKEQLAQYSISGVISTAAFISCNLLFLLVFKLGVVGYITSSIVSSLVSNVYLMIKLHVWKDIVPLRKVGRENFHIMTNYSIPLIFNTVSWWIVMFSDKYIILMFAGASSNGIYSVAQKIPSLLMTVTTLFISAWQISSVQDFGSEESEKLFSNVLDKFQALLLIVSSALIVGEKIVAKLMYSADFYVAWQYTAILLLANLFYALLSFAESVYTASKRTRTSMYTMLFGAGINIVLNFILIPRYGIAGACVATMLSYYLCVILRIFDIRRWFNLQYNFWKSHFQYILLFIQGLLMLRGGSMSYAASACIFLLIVFLNRSIIQDAVRLVRRK